MGRIDEIVLDDVFQSDDRFSRSRPVEIRFQSVRDGGVATSLLRRLGFLQVFATCSMRRDKGAQREGTKEVEELRDGRNERMERQL